MVFSVLAMAVSLTLSLGLMPVVRAVGLVDKPDGQLKSHRQKTPITGGIAILISVGLLSAISDVLDMTAMLVALGLLLVGIVDDLRPMSPWARLLAGAAAGGLLTVSPAISSDFGPSIVSVIFVATAINSVNLLDGADGVAASAGAVASLGLVVLGLARGLEAMFGFVVLGAIGGFLIVNWPPAKSFLGDGGAYVVGVFLSFLVLSAQQPSAPFLQTWLPSFVVAAAMFGVFFLDLLVTIWRRVLSHSKLTKGDRLHIYDRLRQSGWSPIRTAVAVGLTQLVFVLIVQLIEVTFAPWYASILSISLLLVGAFGLRILSGPESPVETSGL